MNEGGREGCEDRLTSPIAREENGYDRAATSGR